MNKNKGFILRSGKTIQITKNLVVNNYELVGKKNLIEKGKILSTCKENCTQNIKETKKQVILLDNPKNEASKNILNKENQPENFKIPHSFSNCVLNYTNVYEKEQENFLKKYKFDKTFAIIQYSNFYIQSKIECPNRYLQQSKYQIVSICHRCFSKLNNSSSLKRHLIRCKFHNPPGFIIHENSNLNISIYEINVDKNVDDKISMEECIAYCRNLCRFSQNFIRHKTMTEDVQLFKFYILVVNKNNQKQIVGYFSKEKQSACYNLSCLLIIPCFENMGYGKILIDLSYKLSVIDGVFGTPEKPLSNSGIIAYRSYWSHVIKHQLKNYFINKEELSVKKLAYDCGIHANDIISTLQYLQLVKYWKGQYLILIPPDYDLSNKYYQFSIALSQIQFYS